MYPLKSHNHHSLQNLYWINSHDVFTSNLIRKRVFPQIRCCWQLGLFIYFQHFLFLILYLSDLISIVHFVVRVWIRLLGVCQCCRQGLHLRFSWLQKLTMVDACFSINFEWIFWVFCYLISFEELHWMLVKNLGLGLSCNC